MTSNTVVKYVFTEKVYRVSAGDFITVEDAYWSNDELIIKSFYVGKDCGKRYAARPIIEMRIDGIPKKLMIKTVEGTVVDKIIIDDIQERTHFYLETKKTVGDMGFNCPICKSCDTTFLNYEDDDPEDDNFIWCNECKSSTMISDMMVDEHGVWHLKDGVSVETFK